MYVLAYYVLYLLGFFKKINHAKIDDQNESDGREARPTKLIIRTSFEHHNKTNTKWMSVSSLVTLITKWIQI